MEDKQKLSVDIDNSFCVSLSSDKQDLQTTNSKFKLGQTLFKVIKNLKLVNYRFPSPIRLIYNSSNLFDEDYRILIEDFLINFTFDSSTQLLKSIELNNVFLLDTIQLNRNNFFIKNGDDSITKISNAYQQFGPTFPPRIDKNGDYVLKFEKRINDEMNCYLQFFFEPLSPSIDTDQSHQLKSIKLNVEMMKDDLNKNQLINSFNQLQLSSKLENDENPLILKLITLWRDENNENNPLNVKGIKLSFFDLNEKNNDNIIDRFIRFGDKAIHVLTILGSPDNVYYSSKGPNDQMQTDEDEVQYYFYNYFEYGLDLMFDTRTHLLHRFIFHTNCPAHYDVDTYEICRFNFDCISSIDPSNNVSYITLEPDSNWREIEQKLRQIDNCAFKLDDYKIMERSPNVDTSDEEDNEMASNPFGPSVYFVNEIDRIIIEFVSRTMSIASIVLYENETKIAN
ncbi:hypothetical protein SNEBB_007089 [Seison nebaliae]|nr:hypothetical protein SNEBB_007089 [Seison nebaliae]